MRFASALLLASLISPSACPGLSAADLPSAESVLELCLIRSGGAEAYARVKGVAMTGTVELVGHNLSGPVTIFQQGEKMYTVIELPGIGKVEEGFDGETSWDSNAMQGARIKEGAEKAAGLRANRLNLLSAWREYYKDARTVGLDDVDGKPAWKLELTPKEGTPETFYFDRDSGMLVRMTQTVATALGDIPSDARFSDYRDVQGLKMPFSLTQMAMSQTMKMHFETVEWNPRFPPHRFDLPDAVKALAARNKR